MVLAGLILSDVSLCACCAGSLYVNRWCKCSVFVYVQQGVGEPQSDVCTLRLFSGYLSVLLPRLPLAQSVIGYEYDWTFSTMSSHVFDTCILALVLIGRTYGRTYLRFQHCVSAPKSSAIIIVSVSMVLVLKLRTMQSPPFFCSNGYNIVPHTTRQVT